MTVADRHAADVREPEGSRAAITPADRAREAWERGPALSDIERRQFEFEGGGAAEQRQLGKRPGWFARLFR